MPFEKGQSGNPSGRPKGSQNRSTKELREAITFLVDNNIDKIDNWLDRIAKEDPKSALQCLFGLMEYSLPKQSRVVVQEEACVEEDVGECVQKILSDVLKDIESNQNLQK